MAPTRLWWIAVIKSDWFADKAVSGAVGLGFAADKLLHLPLLIETRYNFVLTDNTDLKTISKAQNQAFDIWLGIMF